MPQRLPAQCFTALEIAANLWALFVNRAAPRGWIERYASAVTMLVHAEDALSVDGHFFRHTIDRRVEFDQEVAALTTALTGGQIIERVRHSLPPVSSPATTAP